MFIFFTFGCSILLRISKQYNRKSIQSSATHIRVFILPYIPVDNARIIYTSKGQNS
jgi:hypothetical protein